MPIAFDPDALPSDVDYAPDYASARRAFMEAAANLGLDVESHPHPLPGMQGEPLATDVAWLGRRDASRIVVSLSGTHGVEGLYGSGCQVATLRRVDPAALPPDVALMFVHAVNPYGFSWVRRVDSDNVDVNRNFVDHAAPPSNPGYARLHELLLPAEWSPEALWRIRAGLNESIARDGAKATKRAITGGQFTHPDGLFFGGRGPTWSNRTMSALVPRWLGGARAIVVLDHHTGLGPNGHTELICRHPAGSRALELARRWWGSDVTSTDAGESESQVLGGNVRMAFEGWCPRAELVVTTALEVGTVGSEDVIAALVADNWLHQRGDVRSPLADRIRGQVRGAFFVDTPAWRVRAMGRALQVLDLSIEGLRGL